MKRVAIIGAGPAGLVSAKECLDQGLDVTVFEKTDRIGGLWNAGSGVWPDMRTNLSKESCAFPDAPWSDKAPLFPSQKDILAYLSAYKAYFGLERRANFQFETPVKKVSRGAYWEIETDKSTEPFDHVIVASGFFSKPYIPPAQGMENYAGTITHSSQLSPFEDYEGRNVVVVGNAFSGCDIAVGLAQAGANVTQIYRRPVWIVTRMFTGEEGDITIDDAFYRIVETQEMSLSVRYRALNDGLSHICAAQQSEKALYVDPNSDHPPHVSVTDGYIEAVREGRINLVNMQHLEMTPDGFRGIEGKIDDVVFATGFETDLSFLDQDVRSNLDYQPNNRFMPILTHDGMWGEGLDNVAFVGMYRGPFFLTMALQAKWAARAFNQPDLFAPSAHEISHGVNEASNMRNLPDSQRPQFPLGDYVGYVQSLAREIGYEVHYEIDQRVLPSDFNKRGGFKLKI